MANCASSPHHCPCPLMPWQAFDKAAAITNEGGASGRKRRTAGGGMAGKKVLLGNSALTR